MDFIRKHWFNLLLVILFAIAYLKPELGADDSFLQPEILRTAGIALIFFLTGLSLRLADLRAGAGRLRLHVFSQSFCYIFFPAVALLLRFLLDGVFPPQLMDGIVLLAILPTTINSSVIFTMMAKGDVAGAVFNAVGGNLAGVMLSPLLFALLIAPQAGVQIQWAQLGAIGLMIVLPLVIGLTVRPLVADTLRVLRPYLGYVSGSALLMIVFFAFTQALSDESPLWDYAAKDIGGPLALIFALHFFMLAVAWWGSGLFGLSEKDRRTAIFTGPQKTIALGLPLIMVFLAEKPELAGILSLPLVFYHPLQLLVAGPISTHLAAQAETVSAEQA